MKRLRLLAVTTAMFISSFGTVANAQLVNLALGKPVTASQQLNATFPSSKANDGNTSSDQFYHSATSQTTPFWEVDLEGSFAIEEVKLYNRAEGSGNYGNRMNNIFVEVLDEFDNQLYLSSIFNEWDGEGLVSEINSPGSGPHLFDISGVTGSKVRVFKESLPGSPWLALAEVEVFVNAASLTSLVVDRITGAMTLTHAPGAPNNLEFLGYSIISPLGSLESTGWKSIADNYDANSGDMSVDSDDTWTILGDDPTVHTDLSEFQFTGGANDGATLTPGQSVVLSEGNTGAGAAWLATSDENDLRMELSLPGNVIFDVPIVYTGNGGEPLSRSDFDSNGVIDTQDYLILQASFPNNSLSGTTSALQHRQGDSDFDGDVDVDDFFNFRTDYETAFGVGSFQGLLNSVQVPEPTTLVLASFFAIAFAVRRSKATYCLAMALLLSLPCSVANADTLGWWRLGDEDLGVSVDAPVLETEINTVSGWHVRQPANAFNFNRATLFKPRARSDNC